MGFKSILLILLVTLWCVYGSHFRGGLITWKPVGTNQIDVYYRIAFRRSYSSSHMCTDNTIASGSLLSGEGTLVCLSGCSGTLTQMSYYCTDFSETEDWTTGVRTITYTLPTSTSNIFHFGYSSCCWISLVQGGNGDWFVRTIADMNIRNDTGKINSSPTSGVQPIIRFSLGCEYNMKIPVADDDGDVIRCRWARRTPVDECGSVCQTFHGSVLDEGTCTLSYNATGPVGWYAVALQIEDFSSAASTVPLSSVPLQFLVLVSATSEDCSSRPVFPPNIITDGSVHHLLANELFNVTIVARSGSEGVSVTEITTLSPQGMIKSELYPHGNSGREWSVYVTWIPTLSQVGNNIFCFSATDNIGQTSDQVCATLVVHGEELPTTVKTTTKTPQTTESSTKSPQSTLSTTTASTTKNPQSTSSPTTASTTKIPQTTSSPTTESTTKIPQTTSSPTTTKASTTESGIDVQEADSSDTVNYAAVAGGIIGGFAVVGLAALGLARFLGIGRSAKIWGSNMIPNKSQINTNITADNFNTLRYKSEFVSTTPAVSHTFTKY